MKKMLVIDYNFDRTILKKNSKSLQHFNEVVHIPYLDLIENNQKIDLEFFYNSVILINPPITVLSNISGLYSSDKSEALVVNHLVNDSEVLIDFTQLKNVLKKLNNRKLAEKVVNIKNRLLSYGTKDVQDCLVKKLSRKNKSENMSVFITLNDIKELLKGDKLVLSENSRLTPMASDYIKEKKIKIIRESVGEYL